MFASRNIIIRSVLIILDLHKIHNLLHQSPQPHSPLSSVVERVTRNDEVGSSILLAGIFLLLLLTFRCQGRSESGLGAREVENFDMSVYTRAGWKARTAFCLR